jgi:hypothetical protein
VIPEIAIKISFAEAPGAGGATAVLAASGGVEIAPPTLGADATPPPAAAAAEGEYLPPPGAEDEPGDPSDEEALPPSPGRGAKRGR